MKFFQVVMIAVAVVAALGAIAEEKKNCTILFAVAGVLFLASYMIQKII